MMSILDPNKSGKITYHKFLHIFEERESIEAHKWLVSNHRVNDHRHPPLRDQKAFEELLCEKITAHWNQLGQLMRRHDPRGEGLMSRRKLLDILSEVCFTMSEEQLKSLTDQLPDGVSNGRVNYLQLLKLLKVDARPNDAAGLSAQISKSNDEALKERSEDHNRRMDSINDAAQNRTQFMSAAELLIRLQDRLRQHRTELKDSFRQCDHEKRGFITSKDFRKVLHSYGFVMDDSQFREVMQRLGLDTRQPMNYGLFVDHVLQTDFTHPNGMPTTFLPDSNHKVNPIRGDQWSMTAEAVEVKLRQKLRENFTTLREAFHKFDESNQGLLNRNAFRRLLDTFMCSVNDEEFNKLCERLELTDQTMLSYPQFLEKFEIRDSLEEGHKWLVSKHRYNHLPDVKSQAAEDVVAALPLKVHQNYTDVAKAFCRTDYQGKGCITRREFKELLVRLNFMLSESEFRKVWKHYDVGNRGSLNHDAFLHRLELTEQFSSGDQTGPSATIIQNSHDTVVRLLDDQVDRQRLMKENNVLLSQELTLTQIQDLLKTHIRNDFSDIYTAFKHYDEAKAGHLRMKDFKVMLKAVQLNLSEEQFADLMMSYGIRSPLDKISYQRLADMFEDEYSGPRVSSDGSRKSAPESQLSFEGLTPVKAEAALIQQLANQTDILSKALLAFDLNNTGTVSEHSLRNLIKQFCGPLSDEQFKHILAKCQVNTSGQVDYSVFLNLLRNPMDAPLQKGGQQQSAMHIEDSLSRRITEYVKSHPEEAKKSLKSLDPLNGGLLSQSEFKDWISKNVVGSFNDSQFVELWNSLLNKYDHKLQWRKFLQSTRGDDGVSVNLLNIPDTPKSALSQEEDEIQSRNRQILTSLEDNSSSAASVSGDFRDAILKHWQTIFAKCKSMADKDHRVGLSEFIILMREFHVNLLPGELVPMLRRFGLRNDKTFEYAPFLRSVVTTSTLIPKHENLDSIRSKLRTAGLMTQSRGEMTQDFLPAFTRIRQQLLVEWRAMRAEFRTLDPNNNGCVTVGQFRRVLSRFITPIEEDSFYALICHFDPQRKGVIDYNNFLKTFLHTS